MAARGGAEAWLGVPVVKCECRRSRSPVEIRGRRWRLFGRMSHGSPGRLGWLAMPWHRMLWAACGAADTGRGRQTGPPVCGPPRHRWGMELAGAGCSIASVDASLRLQAGSCNGDELLPGDLRKANR